MYPLFSATSSNLPTSNEFVIRPHPTKGGVMTSQYMTFNCVRSSQASKHSEHLRSFWTCPSCEEKMLVTLSGKIRHQVTCEAEEPIREREIEDEAPSGGGIFCESCKKHLTMTPMQFLLHKKSCKSLK